MVDQDRKTHNRTIRLSNKKEVFLVLHDIRSSLNVGSLFRTADAAGVTKIYLTGYTPSPIDRYGRVQKDIAKAALGAEKQVPFVSNASLATLLNQFLKDRVMTVAIEQDKKAIDYKKVNIKLPVAFILGNEVEGLSKAILQKVDVIAQIPMSGTKESLNVSVAGGIALFRMLKR